MIHSYGGLPYNCGYCYKCLTTMVALQIPGVLQKSETFPSSIDLALLRNLFFPDRTFIEELVDGLGFSETDSAIRSSLKEGLSGRSRMRRRFCQDTTYILLTYLPSVFSAMENCAIDLPLGERRHESIYTLCVNASSLTLELSTTASLHLTVRAYNSIL